MVMHKNKKHSNLHHFWRKRTLIFSREMQWLTSSGDNLVRLFFVMCFFPEVVSMKTSWKKGKTTATNKLLLCAFRSSSLSLSPNFLSIMSVQSLLLTRWAGVSIAALPRRPVCRLYGGVLAYWFRTRCFVIILVGIAMVWKVPRTEEA